MLRRGDRGKRLQPHDTKLLWHDMHESNAIMVQRYGVIMWLHIVPYDITCCVGMLHSCVLLFERCCQGHQKDSWIMHIQLVLVVVHVVRELAANYASLV